MVHFPAGYRVKRVPRCRGAGRERGGEREGAYYASRQVFTPFCPAYRCNAWVGFVLSVGIVPNTSAPFLMRESLHAVLYISINFVLALRIFYSGAGGRSARFIVFRDNAGLPHSELRQATGVGEDVV